MKKGIKTKFAEIITNIFSYISQVPCKFFATQCFFADHLKDKTANKTTCKTTLASPCQLRAH